MSKEPVTATQPSNGGIAPGIAPTKTAKGVFLLSGVYAVVYKISASKPRTPLNGFIK